MVVFKFSKTNGAQFIPHIDVVRHVGRTLLRAKINVNYSQGFNKHLRIFLTNPTPLGLVTYGEYCFVEGDCTAEGFIEKFNAVSPKGIKAIQVKNCNKNPNVTAKTAYAKYEISGIEKENALSLLNEKEFYIINKKGEREEVRQKIKDIYEENGNLYFILSFGNVNLRIDDFCMALEKKFGGEVFPTKIDVYDKDLNSFFV